MDTSEKIAFRLINKLIEEKKRRNTAAPRGDAVVLDTMRRVACYLAILEAQLLGTLALLEELPCSLATRMLASDLHLVKDLLENRIAQIRKAIIQGEKGVDNA